MFRVSIVEKRFQVTDCSLDVRLIAGYYQVSLFLIDVMMRSVCSTLCLAVLILLAGCDPLTLTALGVGAGAGINHTMNGYTYHTFSEPLPRVKQAALVALGRMSIKVESSEKDGVFETINAKSSGRSIELELEVISPKATRLRSIARKNAFVMDSATAEEIIAQTRRALTGA